MVDRGLLSLLHFADSALPTGGYAHSLGLETYCAEGIIVDRAGLEAFLVAHLEGAAGPGDATAAAATGAAIRAGDIVTCEEIDCTLEAMKPAAEARAASRQMGRQTLRLGATLTGDERLAGYLTEVEGGRRPGHHGVAFGMAGGVLGWSGEETAVAFLYSSSAVLVGAGLRLLRMGQVEGQRVLWALGPVIERLAREAAVRDRHDMWGFAPGTEIQVMRHPALATRLFRS